MLVSLFSSTAEEVAARSSITASQNKEKINKITSFFCELLCFHFFPQEHGRGVSIVGPYFSPPSFVSLTVHNLGFRSV